LKYDVVTAASNLRYDDGNLIIADGATEITDDGITLRNAVLRPTAGAEGDLATKLGVPVQYLRGLRESALDSLVPDPAFGGTTSGGLLLDVTANSHFQVAEGKVLVRAFLADGAHEGIFRAYLSDRFSMIDNYDVLLAALDGIRQVGVNVEVTGCDLTDRQMRVKVACPEVMVHAPRLLAGYRNPHPDGGIPPTGRMLGAPGHEQVNDVVFAGFVLSNGETGGAAFSITPRLEVLVCRNGLTVKKDAMRQVHLGGRLDEGTVRWSEDTQRKSVELITAKARDAVTSFLDVDYVAAQVEAITAKAEGRIVEPSATIERIGKRFGFSQAEQDGILSMFIAGGQPTTGGMLQAVTAYAQHVDDGDRAADLEDSALDVLDFVAS
jgi:hypothetical protein